MTATGSSAVVLRGLGGVERRRRVVGAAVVRPGVETLHMLAVDRLLRPLILAQALAALSAGATSAMLVVLAQRRLHTHSAGYGLMLAAIATGGLAGRLLLSRLRVAAPGPTAVFGAFALRSAVDAVLATVIALPAALAALVGYGPGTVDRQRRVLSAAATARAGGTTRPGLLRLRLRVALDAGDTDDAVRAPATSAAKYTTVVGLTSVTATKRR